MSSDLNFNDLQQLITRIYDAGMDEKQWGHTLGYLTQEFNAEQSILRVLNTEERQVGLVHTYNKDPVWDLPYRSYYVKKDPWLELFSKSKDSVVTCTHHHMDDKKYESYEFYNDFVKPQKFHHGLGGLLKLDSSNDAYLIFHRRKECSTFSNQELELMKTLVPHFRRGLLIAEKTRSINFELHLLKDALNRITSPLVLVNKDEKILFINELAEDLIKRQYGVSIKNNRMVLSSPAHQNLLSRLIDQSTQTDRSGYLKQGGGMNYSIPESNIRMYFMVSPVNPEQVNLNERYVDCALILLNTNTCCATISQEVLTQLYDMSTAEARLTVELCLGLSLDEISEKFSLSKNTLRSQLRVCFRKTAVDRQSALVNLVKNGPAGKIK